MFNMLHKIYPFLQVIFFCFIFESCHHNEIGERCPHPVGPYVDVEIVSEIPPRVYYTVEITSSLSGKVILREVNQLSHSQVQFHLVKLDRGCIWKGKESVRLSLIETPARKIVAQFELDTEGSPRKFGFAPILTSFRSLSGCSLVAFTPNQWTAQITNRQTPAHLKIILGN